MQKYFFGAACMSLLFVGAGCVKNNPTPTNTATSLQNSAVSAPTAPPSKAPTVAPSVSATTMTISMKPKGGEDEYGTATFTKVDENHTKISIILKNVEMRSAEDAGLFVGPCSSISATPQYDLAAVIKGKSETTLNVNYSALAGGDVQSVRVFSKPLNAQSSYWVCGDVK